MYIVYTTYVLIRINVWYMSTSSLIKKTNSLILFNSHKRSPQLIELNFLSYSLMNCEKLINAFSNIIIKEYYLIFIVLVGIGDGIWVLHLIYVCSWIIRYNTGQACLVMPFKIHQPN